MSDIKGRIMGVDFGDVRTGLAVSDPTGFLASGAGSVRCKDLKTTARLVAEEGKKHGVSLFVVGLPINMNGTEGDRGAHAREFADELKAVSELPVELLEYGPHQFALCRPSGFPHQLGIGHHGSEQARHHGAGKRAGRRYFVFHGAPPTARHCWQVSRLCRFSSSTSPRRKGSGTSVSGGGSRHIRPVSALRISRASAASSSAGQWQRIHRRSRCSSHASAV